MRPHGLSTLEIMTVCAMIGGLVTLSLPSFSEHTHAARRADGHSALLAIQQAQELYRSRHPTYAASMTALSLSDTSSQGHYRLSTQSSDEPDAKATHYRVLAVGQHAQANDQRCLYLAIDNQAGQTIERSGPTADLGNDSSANRQCWRR
jgi:type IV pilus assembly protein PilE